METSQTDQGITKAFNLKLGTGYSDRVAFYFPARLNLDPEFIIPATIQCSSCDKFEEYATIGEDGNDPNTCNGGVTYTDGTNEIVVHNNSNDDQNTDDTTGGSTVDQSEIQLLLHYHL